MSCSEDANNKIRKATKGIRLLRKLQPILLQKSLLIIRNSYIGPHFENGDVIFDQQFNASFLNKTESVEYNAGLEITLAIKGFSPDKLYQELGLGMIRF